MPRPHYRGAPALWPESYAAEVLAPLGGGVRMVKRESRGFASAPGGVIIVDAALPTAGPGRRRRDRDVRRSGDRARRGAPRRRARLRASESGARPLSANGRLAPRPGGDHRRVERHRRAEQARRASAVRQRLGFAGPAPRGRGQQPVVQLFPVARDDERLPRGGPAGAQPRRPGRGERPVVRGPHASDRRTRRSGGRGALRAARRDRPAPRVATNWSDRSSASGKPRSRRPTSATAST